MAPGVCNKLVNRGNLFKENHRVGYTTSFAAGNCRDTVGTASIPTTPSREQTVEARRVEGATLLSKGSQQLSVVESDRHTQRVGETRRRSKKDWRMRREERDLWLLEQVSHTAEHVPRGRLVTAIAIPPGNRHSHTARRTIANRYSSRDSSVVRFNSFVTDRAASYRYANVYYIESM